MNIETRLNARLAVRDEFPAIPTGWHVIGHTRFANFDPARTPPTVMRVGETVRFEAMT